MKKVLFILGLLVCTATQAQITVTKTDGTPIANNQVFTFTSTEYDDAYLGFLVHNNTAASIDVRILVESVTNPTGGMELCLGNVCLSNVVQGNAYPSSAVTIAPGGTNSEFDHFWNTHANNGGVSDYKFTFYIEDEFGGSAAEIVSMIYRYDPNALATDVFSSSAQTAVLKSGLVSNVLEVKATKNTLLEIFDVNGKSLRKEQLSSGEHIVDVSDFASGVYIARFNADNQSATTKFIKK
ncbi:T9SS type A sorting domain-containing protein [Flavobacterium caeni]|uniref:Por secretion system C-terminal sorting domain-containing protein n=1 Tax=Flavobacterium caeni TaxID=490189 RepID=A0A1G5INQ4_9FLAO|nr:T9SS type A sorting domain-containing protein [Flavobacterium caeni]SCY77391.1 Por secretion system C-terminal sorting domain-containing protein [Flavobacterium caeni]